MILPPVVGSIVAVLLLASPVLSKDTPPVPLPDDPSAALQDQPSTSTSAAATPGWLVCSRRCKTNCLSSPNADKCAKNFISNHCRPFGTSTAATVKSLCLGAITCLKNGNGVCDNNMECILPGQCCLDRGCNSNTRCLNHWCAAKGLPSFTLMWSGYDDLDLHVMTPGGVELAYYYEYDPVSGGRFQHDDVPADTNSTWQETVYFPLEGTAPAGVYKFYVANNHYDPDPARPFVIKVYEGEVLKATKRGTVENQDYSATYRYRFTP